jgi:hypothetical protein
MSVTMNFGPSEASAASGYVCPPVLAATYNVATVTGEVGWREMELGAFEQMVIFKAWGSHLGEPVAK